MEELKKSSQAFLEALKSSVWGRPINSAKFEGLNRGDWVEIFHMSFQQTVEGHLAEAIQGLPVHLLPPSDLSLKWIVRLQRIEERNKLMEVVIGRLSKLFLDNGINALLMKGHAVSPYYIRPEIRVSGDVDWYFPSDLAYNKALKLMERIGENFHNRTSLNCDYVFDGFEIEHHNSLIQLYNPFKRKKINDLIQNQFKESISRDFNGNNVAIPSNLLCIILGSAHILKHQVGYGIGLRQLVDSARLYYHFFDQVDVRLIQEIYSGLGILKWSHRFHQVLLELLEFPAERLPYPVEGNFNISWMKDFILKTGNFGFYDPENPDILNPGGRVNREVRLLKNIIRFLPLAPLEALSFPFVHTYSKVFR